MLTGEGNLEVKLTSGAATSAIWQSKLDYPGKRVSTGARLATISGWRIPRGWSR